MNSSASFGDARLDTRSALIRDQLGLQADKSVPKRILNRDQVKGYYRFVNNKRVTPEKLVLKNRPSSLSQALESGEIILSIQDTTELDYTNKRSAKEVGPMEYANRRGMYLHNHILLSRSGVPQGIFSQPFLVRDEKGLGQGAARRHLPIEEKESYRWLEAYRELESAFAAHRETPVLCICDREADIHELLECRQQAHVHYLIRSRTDRRLDQSESYLYAEVGKVSAAFSFDLYLPAREGQTARTASLSSRYTSVVIRPGYRPKNQKQLGPVELYVVEVREENPPLGVEPLCWRLLSSMPVCTDEQAKEMILFYTYRWIIERFHFVLKQGFLVEDRQIKDQIALQNAIVIDSWPAIQICALQYQAINHPQLPVENAGVNPKEVGLLVAYLTQKYKIKRFPENLHTVGGFHRLVAMLGGFQNQKNKTPGVVNLWRGWQRFMMLLEVYDLKNGLEKDVGNG